MLVYELWEEYKKYTNYKPFLSDEPSLSLGGYAGELTFGWRGGKTAIYKRQFGDRSSDYFDMINGSFCEHAPQHSHFLMPSDASKIGLLTRLGYPTMHLCKMTRQERNRCLDVILDYYRLHIPDFPELKSYHVLKEMFM